MGEGFGGIEGKLAALAVVNHRETSLSNGSFE
jgi:hypothetical protein